MNARTLDADVLDRSVTGRNLRPGTFGDQLSAGDEAGEASAGWVFLAFLRHFG